jgi:tetratricopeptide (TPR) repeat protein
MGKAKINLEHIINSISEEVKDILERLEWKKDYAIYKANILHNDDPTDLIERAEHCEKRKYYKRAILNYALAIDTYEKVFQKNPESADYGLIKILRQNIERIEIKMEEEYQDKETKKTNS